MRQNLLELFKVLLLEQEHHVIGQDECVAGTDVDSLLKRHLGVVNVRGALQSKSQVTQGFFVIWFDFKSVKEVDRC